MSERLGKYVHSEACYGFQPNQTYAVDLMEEVGGITVKEDEGYVTALLARG